jgi:hypothetical protein
MVEIHNVLEDESAARLHLMTKNQGGLQDAPIISQRIGLTLISRITGHVGISTLLTEPIGVERASGRIAFWRTTEGLSGVLAERQSRSDGPEENLWD